MVPKSCITLYCFAQAWLVEHRNERGQASTEYAGILFVIVAIIAALVGLSYTDVGEAIKGKIIEAVDSLGG